MRIYVLLALYALMSLGPYAPSAAFADGQHPPIDPGQPPKTVVKFQLSGHARTVLAGSDTQIDPYNQVAMAAEPALIERAPRYSATSISADVRCLTATGYAEARGEGPTGMRAVQWVVINRAQAAQTSPCHEIARPGAFHTFSHLGTRLPALPHPSNAGDAVMLDQAQTSAIRIATGHDADITHGALFFQRLHPGHRLPKWAGHFTARIGEHVFSSPQASPAT